jgi:hypothetical protein
MLRSYESWHKTLCSCSCTWRKITTSIKASFYLENNPENLLEALQYCLSGEDDSQRTARFRALLEFSGGRVDCLQHESVPNYTSSENVRDYASFLGIARTRSFGDVDYEDMCK